jgi:hypothetical protein
VWARPPLVAFCWAPSTQVGADRLVLKSNSIEIHREGLSGDEYTVQDAWWQLAARVRGSATDGVSIAGIEHMAPLALAIEADVLQAMRCPGEYFPVFLRYREEML